ncbi:hypothetical protein QQM39_42815 [Streptomyces sp. DT2A-34]|uniref:hypothetical protein n=1 Tax=Streptomyces sp. DT2A-34 TaxID=3051182 RepID=UPI00265BD055|nr:hypothetical protein [Streptomyces sp. DT2A-34]MDO0917299.1 hypothetical protein [Streptomyces sp. DT2A-34]
MGEVTAAQFAYGRLCLQADEDEQGTVEQEGCQRSELLRLAAIAAAAMRGPAWLMISPAETAARTPEAWISSARR